MKLFFPSLHDRPNVALAATVLIAVVLAVLPFVLGMAGNRWIRMADFALLYVMLALGLNIVVGYAGLLDLGYVAFYAVGAYMYALLASPHLMNNFEWIAATFPNGLHSSIWLVVPLSASIAAFLMLSGVLPCGTDHRCSPVFRSTATTRPYGGLRSGRPNTAGAGPTAWPRVS